MATRWKKYLLATVVLFMGYPITPAIAEIIIVANSGVQESVVSAYDLKQIFLRKKKNLAGGVVTIAVQKKTDIHAEFLRKFIKKTPSQFKRYYKKMIFSGKGKSPLVLQDDAAMLSWVAQTPGAMGYVSVSPPKQRKVKVSKCYE